MDTDDNSNESFLKVRKEWDLWLEISRFEITIDYLESLFEARVFGSRPEEYNNINCTVFILTGLQKYYAKMAVETDDHSIITNLFTASKKLNDLKMDLAKENVRPYFDSTSIFLMNLNVTLHQSLRPVTMMTAE